MTNYNNKLNDMKQLDKDQEIYNQKLIQLDEECQEAKDELLAGEEKIDIRKKGINHIFLARTKAKSAVKYCEQKSPIKYDMWLCILNKCSKMIFNYDEVNEILRISKKTSKLIHQYIYIIITHRSIKSVTESNTVSECTKEIMK